MRKEEIDRIIEDNFARDPTAASLFQTREDILRKVLGSLAEGRLPDAHKDLLSTLATVEGKFNAFNFLLQRNEGGLAALSVGVLEQFLILYENCQRLCEFLVDIYDEAPAYLKSKLIKDDLIAIVVTLQVEREKAWRDLVEGGRYNFPKVLLETFRNVISFTMLAILGEEPYCYMMAELNDAMAIVRKHPKCREFFAET